ncbi:MAG: DNA-directed RNA polymerase subunit alpha [Thermoguttaceae bacterium]
MRIRWRGLELPSKVVCNNDKLTETFGEFAVEPFERGFGNTVGNSLRRVLLSSLEGSAVTRIRIKNTLHEFTALPGVLEDVSVIALNIKSLVVKNHDEKPKVLRIKKDVAGPITSDDISGDSNVEIINKSHLIATLTDNVPFEMELIVENGRGYVPAAEQFARIRDRGEEIGFIPLDAAFSPVLRVQYSVEETRIGQKTNYDRMTMRIWTDGSVGPQMALVEGAKILRKHLNPFLQYDSLDSPVYSKVASSSASGVDPSLDSILSKSITELQLSVRATNCLENEKLSTIRDLVTKNDDQLLEVRNFGETTLMEVKEKLAGLGLRLGMRLSGNAMNPEN